MIDIYQQEGSSQGYVWEPQGAVDLRAKHRLLGAYLGGVANFKNQNEVQGLPLQLGSDEIKHAVTHGWATLHPPALAAQQATLAPRPTDQDVSHSQPNATYPSKRQKRRGDHADPGGRLPPWLASYFDYYQHHYPAPQEDSKQPAPAAATEAATANNSHHRTQQQHPAAKPAPPWLVKAWWLKQYYQYYEAQGAYTDTQHAYTADTGAPMQQAGSEQVPAPGPMEWEVVEEKAEGIATGEHAQQTQGRSRAGPDGIGNGTGDPKHEAGGSGRASKGPSAEPEPWKAALQEGAPFVVPVQAVMVAASGADPQAGGSSKAGGTSWLERTREAVFADLHSKGYAMSAGPKFGADMLAYPGDPSLYHAQFTVRFLESDQPINPLSLKAAARGSHAARKHMLLAALPRPASGDAAAAGATARNDARQPLYITIAPEAGFGRAG